VVLINSVLASIPVFYLSFQKIPLKVRMDIVRLQRNFLLDYEANHLEGGE
jgi:hypothetical protein